MLDNKTDKVTMTLPSQSLTLFHETGKTADGREYDLWRGELDDVPPNAYGVTVCQFTDRDISDDIANKLVSLKTTAGVTKDGNKQYIYCGVVRATVEFTAIRAVTRKDGSQFLAARVSINGVERAESKSAAVFAASFAAK